MKYIKPINEFWGDVLKRDLLGETREEDKFRSKKELIEYLSSEIEKQGENVVIQNLDVSLIEDLSYLFCKITYGGEKVIDLSEVKTLDLSGWKTSGVKNMYSMFWECKPLESLDLSGWDTSNVTSMEAMFFGCNRLKSIDMTGWDTSEVTNMNSMFFICKNLNHLIYEAGILLMSLI